eukprot:scpid106202/ scgid26678/ 
MAGKTVATKFTIPKKRRDLHQALLDGANALDAMHRRAAAQQLRRHAAAMQEFEKASDVFWRSNGRRLEQDPDRLEAGEPPAKKAQPAPKPKEPVCWRCSSTGHRMKDCTALVVTAEGGQPNVAAGDETALSLDDA